MNPSSAYEGDSVRVQANGTATDGSLDGIRIDGPAGTLMQSTGSTLDQTLPAPASGTYTATPIEPGATPTSRTATFTRNAHTVTGQWLDQNLPAGSPARYMVRGTKGISDSIFATIAGQEFRATGDSGIFVFTPAAAGTYTASPRAKNNDHLATGAQSPLTATAAPVAFRIQLYDMDGNPALGQRTMLIDSIPYTSDANGLVTANVLPGVHRVGYARTNPNDTTATRLELPTSYQNPVRIIFPRFKISQNAPPGEDTVSVKSATTARAIIAGLGANFNKEHHAGYFDDPIYGQQGPRTGKVRFHILTQPDSRYPLCQAMAPSTLATWRQFQTNQLTELQGYYAVANTEGALPQTLTSGDYVVLCQGPVVGAEIFREPANGTFKKTVAYIFSNSPIGEANTEALQVPYGSSGIEGKCTVRSVFNDPNLSDPLCSMGTSPTATAYDRREGLDMVRDFATPANNRALITPTIYAQTFGGPVNIYLSLRKN
jgi:hypothetical protein